MIARLALSAAGLLGLLTGQAGLLTPPHALLRLDAQAGPAPVLTIDWRASPGAMADASEAGWTQLSVAGHSLLARLIVARALHERPVDITTLEQDAVPAPAPARVPLLQPVSPPPIRPHVLQGGWLLDGVDTVMPDLPRAPLVVLREGRIRRARLIVLAFFPLFTGERPGEWRAVTRLRARVAGVVLEDAREPERWETHAPQMAALSLSAPHTLALANQPAVKLLVERAGIQRVAGAQLLPALSAAGIDPLTPPHRLRLYRDGVVLPLHWIGAQDGRLDADDELRFYAPAFDAPVHAPVWVGDRWNQRDVYWLVAMPTAGPQMALSPALTLAGWPTRPDAIEQGEWRDDRRYDSTTPGPDGDHWFSAALDVDAGGPPVSRSLALSSTLPAAGLSFSVTAQGSAYTAGPRTLRARWQMPSAPAGVVVSRTWSGAGDWMRPFAPDAGLPPGPHRVYLPVVARAGALPAAPSIPDGRPFTLTLELSSGAGFDSLALDRVWWERPVWLDLDGRGAMFSTLPGAWCYQTSHWPASATLYDVTDALAPQVISGIAGASPRLCVSGARRLIVAGPGALGTPQLVPHTPVDLLAPRVAAGHAFAFYIAPRAFITALTPLVDLRRAQGYAVEVVDAQAIYDTWSFGRVSPQAIRAFIRHAYFTWLPAPAGVTLVGDGSADPFDRTQRGPNNVNWIPPYLAMVDPWLGETACETCFGQVDGDDALDDPLPDVAIGRLPAKTVAEVQVMARKLVSYEAGPPAFDWQPRLVFIADNYREANGATDPYGDFAALADVMLALQPAGARVERLYYDPYLPTAGGAPWREPNAAQAHNRVLGLLNAGAGLAQYTGHGNYYQWAVTDLSVAPPYLFGIDQPYQLTNAGRLPVVLEMTCLTAAFHTPLFRGATIDEQLLLAPQGGAAAVWGPTGLSVIYSHTWLPAGFYARLWAQPGRAQRLGDLVEAGYLRLFGEGGCCQDALRSYALLGDPLMRARVFAVQNAYLPVGRQ